MSVKITGTLKPSGDFGLVEDTYLIGGMRAVPDADARDSIPQSRKKEGMIVYVIQDNKFYQLNSDNKWDELSIGSSDSSSDSNSDSDSDSDTKYVVVDTYSDLNDTDADTGTVGYVIDEDNFYVYTNQSKWRLMHTEQDTVTDSEKKNAIISAMIFG